MPLYELEIEAESQFGGIQEDESFIKEKWQRTKGPLPQCAPSATTHGGDTDELSPVRLIDALLNRANQFFS